ncbi:MAG TPA: excinuclease ABC subunit UvrC, partial [Rhizobiales bacterium]|nr:excinuclease ABC subunit UvrC [Hyphomicrobiales bacterium]
KPCPPLILLSHEIAESELIARALSLRSERKVNIIVPRRGEKRELIAHAVRNAEEALARRMAESASQRKLLARIQELFDLDAPPRRIEIYDNSHIQGAHAIGAMVVAGPEGFEKKHYRTFNIKSRELTPGDDFAMMEEVLTRRFRQLARAQENEEDANWPDLVLIDGGAGQLSAARKVLDELGISRVALAGIAKGPERNAGRERFFINSKPPFSLPSRDPVLYYLQRLRDEAHRFAIGTHRARRKKAQGISVLDAIPGVGPGRKRALLRHFGSAKAVSRASVADLTRVKGISTALAKTINDYFHGGMI